MREQAERRCRCGAAEQVACGACGAPLCFDCGREPAPFRFCCQDCQLEDDRPPHPLSGPTAEQGARGIGHRREPPDWGGP